MRGIYVHIPFCERKCPYCSFNSYHGQEKLIYDYVKRAILEIRSYPRERVDTVYFGGGTPTFLPAEETEKLLFAAREHFYLENESEITIEANPGTSDTQKLVQLKNSGFNRISIGVQSFNADELLALGRVHTPTCAENAVMRAWDAGFKNISADIMFGTPGQTIKSLGHTLDKMLSLPVSHISAYSLSVDEGTRFYEMRDTLKLADEDTERQMYRTIIKRLGDEGFRHYEISNFAKDGFYSRHNTKYWTGEEYIGIGAGAHSYYKNERYGNICGIKEYIGSADPSADREFIDGAEREREYYILGLRLLEGVLDRGHPAVDTLVGDGLLERCGGNIRLTERGLDLANYVLAKFM